MNSLTKIVTFRARPGEGEQLADRLLFAAGLAAEASGCEQWLVHRDAADPDVVRVHESWASREQCEAALSAEGAAANIEAIVGLLAEPPAVIEGVPAGGARVLTGVAGATVFSIPDAPDLSQDTELLSSYELEDVGEARYVREELGAVQTGLTHYRLPAGRSQGWAHRHRSAEEIYVVIGGSGRIRVDAESHELGPLDAVRVAPASVRELEGGEGGLEVLAFGVHLPGDGEMASAESTE